MGAAEVCITGSVCAVVCPGGTEVLLSGCCCCCWGGDGCEEGGIITCWAGIYENRKSTEKLKK